MDDGVTEVSLLVFQFQQGRAARFGNQGFSGEIDLQPHSDRRSSTTGFPYNRCESVFLKISGRVGKRSRCRWGRRFLDFVVFVEFPLLELGDFVFVPDGLHHKVLRQRIDTRCCPRR